MTRKTLARRNREAQEQREQEQEQGEFDANKGAIWLNLWARALQLFMLKDEHSVHKEHDWFFDGFSLTVDVGQEAIELTDVDREPITQERLTLDMAQDLKRLLDQGFDLVASTLEKREAARREAERRAQVKAGALAKLNEEERKVLGLQG